MSNEGYRKRKDKDEVESEVEYRFSESESDKDFSDNEELVDLDSSYKHG